MKRFEGFVPSFLALGFSVWAPTTSSIWSRLLALWAQSPVRWLQLKLRLKMNLSNLSNSPRCQNLLLLWTQVHVILSQLVQPHCLASARSSKVHFFSTRHCLVIVKIPTCKTTTCENSSAFGNRVKVAFWIFDLTCCNVMF